MFWKLELIKTLSVRLSTTVNLEYSTTDKPLSLLLLQIDEGILAPKVTAVNYHGSLMIQNLLRFANNRPIISSMFELKPVELKDVCCDSCGSYIIEVFLNTAKEKSLGMLYNKLKVYII